MGWNHQLDDLCSCYRLCIKYLLRNLENIEIWVEISSFDWWSFEVVQEAIRLVIIKYIWIFFIARICLANKAVTAFPCIP